MNYTSLEEISAVAQRAWSNRQVAHKIALDAASILSRTRKRNWAFYSGKAPKTLIAGLFYLLGFRYDAEKKQKQIAKCLGTTEMTVRTSYRSWLKEFPDLFLDVIGKFAEHSNLRYFVLLELGQTKLQTVGGSRQ